MRFGISIGAVKALIKKSLVTTLQLVRRGWRLSEHNITVSRKTDSQSAGSWFEIVIGEINVKILGSKYAEKRRWPCPNAFQDLD
jgi:hypothetical protein